MKTRCFANSNDTEMEIKQEFDGKPIPEPMLPDT